MKAPLRARPLTDRVKEALFNILRERVADADFLDLFAGSGAVGIEALSRGAKSAVLVELDRSAVNVIKENLSLVGFNEQALVLSCDAVNAIVLLDKQARMFDLVFLGAPYDSPALEEALGKISQVKILRPGALVIAEHRKQHILKNAFDGLKNMRNQRYGETELSFYEYCGLSR